MRLFTEIVKSIAQIGSMLLFVVCVQAELFWVLEKNSKVPTYSSKPFNGIFYAFLDSYQMAIGDFEPVQNSFQETDFMWIFWVLFFFGTILSLVLLLNMVIAVMSMALETVVQDQTALVNREKLLECISNYRRLPDFL